MLNGKHHSVWFVPTAMKGLPQNVLLNFRLEFPKSDLTIYLSSGVSEIFRQMVTPQLTQNFTQGSYKKIQTIFKGLFKDHIRFSRSTYQECYFAHCKKNAHSQSIPSQDYKAPTVSSTKFSTFFSSIVLNQ